MSWSSHSPFRQLREIIERCFSDLGRRELRPRELWFTDDPENLENVKTALARMVRSMESSLMRLGEVEDKGFAAVMNLDEWLAIGREVPDWKRDIEILRPAADSEHVKARLLSIRTRISELAEKLAVRAALRDPSCRVANSVEAEKTIAGLREERELRELGLGLLTVTWKEMLDASVTDWSVKFGPQHRVELAQFCHKLLHELEAVQALKQRSPSVEPLATLGDELGARLGKIYDRLIEIPTDRRDAGVASDFHYMAELAKKIVDGVTGHHAAIIGEYAGRPLPEPVADLFRLLHLHVPRVRRTTTSRRSLTREDLERELGLRLWDTGPKT